MRFYKKLLASFEIQRLSHDEMDVVSKQKFPKLFWSLAPIELDSGYPCSFYLIFSAFKSFNKMSICSHTLLLTCRHEKMYMVKYERNNSEHYLVTSFESLARIKVS